MRKIFFIIICCILGFIACTEERAEYYEGEDNWVQFYYIWPVEQTYISPVFLPYEGYRPMLSSTKRQDTVYFRLHLIGRPSDKPRKVKFETYEAEMEYNYFLPAVPGEDYIAFDDPLMESYLTIPRDSAYVNIPVIVKYNPVKMGNTLQADFRLVDSEDLVVGDSCLMKGRFILFQGY